MTLLLIAGIFGAFIAGLSVRPLGEALAARRLPPQVFMGRVFPHPDDDGWRVGRFDAWLGPVHVDHDPATTTHIKVNEVVVYSGPRARRYLTEIIARHGRRGIDKALEAIP